MDPARALSVVLACAILWAVPCAAAEKGKGKAAGPAGGQAPIVITAKSMFADNKKKVVVYKKDVVVKKADITMYAEEVTIHLKGQDKAVGAAGMFNGSGKVDTIEARGKVRIVQEDKTATSDVATYYSATDKIILKGHPRVWQGDNVLTGSTIAYDVQGDTFEAEDANTTLYQAEKAAGGTPKPEGGQ